jgi:glycine oxidase
MAIDEIGAGFRPTLRDHLPAIGPAGMTGLYVATGHFRHGVLLAPATAALLMDAIETGQVPRALWPFRPGRFAGEAA